MSRLDHITKFKNKSIFALRKVRNNLKLVLGQLDVQEAIANENLSKLEKQLSEEHDVLNQIDDERDETQNTIDNLNNILGD